MIWVRKARASVLGAGLAPAEPADGREADVVGGFVLDGDEVGQPICLSLSSERLGDLSVHPFGGVFGRAERRAALFILRPVRSALGIEACSGLLHAVAGAGVDISLQHPPAHGLVAVSEGYSDRHSRTSLTARSRSAGSIFFGMTYILPTQKEAASHLGRFTYDRSRPWSLVGVGREAEDKVVEVISASFVAR